MSDLKIQYQNGPFWVAKVPAGYEVNRNEGTHSVRCASIGFKGEPGLKRAIAEADRRAAALSQPPSGDRMTELTETERGLAEAAGKLVAKYLTRLAFHPQFNSAAMRDITTGVVVGFVVGEMLKDLHQLGFGPAQVRELVHKRE